MDTITTILILAGAVLTVVWLWYTQARNDVLQDENARLHDEIFKLRRQLAELAINNTLD